MAINCYRTVLGVGVSLMTMQLIIGIGVQFLQQLVASTSQTLDASQIGILLSAVIILAVISHRLPHMVAGMVVGGGHNGAIGGVGVMTLFAAGMTGMGLATRLSGNPAAMLAAEGVGEGPRCCRIASLPPKLLWAARKPRRVVSVKRARLEMGQLARARWASRVLGKLALSPGMGDAPDRGVRPAEGGQTSFVAASGSAAGAEPVGGGKTTPTGDDEVT
jgi:hypothetical protein